MYRGILERLRRIDQGLAREPHQQDVGTVQAVQDGSAQFVTWCS
jgi:hypothetical protein